MLSWYELISYLGSFFSGTSFQLLSSTFSPSQTTLLRFQDTLLCVVSFPVDFGVYLPLTSSPSLCNTFDHFARQRKRCLILLFFPARVPFSQRTLSTRQRPYSEVWFFGFDIRFSVVIITFSGLIHAAHSIIGGFEVEASETWRPARQRLWVSPTWASHNLQATRGWSQL